MAEDRIELELVVDDKGTVTVKRFLRTTEEETKKTASKVEKALTKGFTGWASKAHSVLSSVVGKLTSIKGLLTGMAAGYGLKKLSDSFINVASKVERMKASLDTLTKGHGEEWFERLNDWALKMPINTEKAVQAFIMLRAMGLRPTIKDMTILVDTTSALGGGADTLEGIARALGQMATKGKVSAEELMQLAERGIPAYEILREKLGLTGEQLSNIGNQGIQASEAIQALLEGMAERFGGQSAKIQNTWAGLVETLRSYWKEFQRLVMESGVLTSLEEILKTIVKKLDQLKREGRLDEWARNVGKTIVEIIADVVEAIGKIPEAFYEVNKAIHKTISFMAAMGSTAIDVAAFVAATVNPYWAVKLAGKGLQGKDLGTSLRELFPTLAKYKDKLDEIGTSQYSAALDAERSAQKFHSFAEALRKAADKMREIGSHAFRARKPLPPTAPALPPPPGGKKGLGPDAEALKEYERLHKQVVERIKRSTLSETDFKLWQLDRWYEHAMDVYKKAGKDTTELTQQYLREKTQIEEQAAEEAKKRLEEEARKERERWLKAHKNTREYLEWHLKQMEENGATIKELEQEKWEWMKKYTDDALLGMKIGWNEYLQDVQTVTQRMADLVRESAQAMEKSFSDFFFDVIQGKLKRLSDYVRTFFNSLARATADVLAQQTVGWIGGWVKSKIPASKTPTGPSKIIDPRTGKILAIRTHQGGIVGSPGIPTQLVPASLFLNAPRLHEGLKPDEFPAILQKGEEVIPRNQARQPTKVTVNIINKGLEEKKAEVSKVRMDARQLVLDIVLTDLAENGPLRQALGVGGV